MEIEDNNSAPAGGAEMPTSMTLDAAVSLMSQWPDDEADTPATTKQEATTETPSSEEPSQSSDETVATETPDDGATEGETTQSEDSAIDWDKVPGTAKFRLRDGTEVTAADLKRDYDALRTARQTQEELQSKMAEFQTAQSRIAQEAQLFAQMAPRAIAALKASIPEVPPYPGRELLSDPIAYQEALDAHNRGIQQRNEKIAEIQRLEHAAQYQAQQDKAKRDAEFQQKIASEREKLFEKMPDLRDQAKLESFTRDIQEVGTKHYGFKPEEMDIWDHRVVAVLRDAIAYRKLQSNPPKPVTQAPKQSAPVAAPTPRASADAQKVQRVEQLKQQVRKSGGSIRDVAAILDELD